MAQGPDPACEGFVSDPPTDITNYHKRYGEVTIISCSQHHNRL